MSSAAAIVLTLLCWGAATEIASACSPGPVNLEALRKSDIIATGVIHIIERTERTSDGWTTIEGTAELRIGKELRNRTSLVAPFTFHFEYVSGEGCIFGLLPEDGSATKVYLGRAAPHSNDLSLIYLEPLAR